MRNAFHPFASTLLGLAAAAQVASAQPAQVPPAPPAPPPPAEIQGPPLSLADAVATALKLHPSIRAARADLAARRADIGTARGPFDPLFNAALQHAHEATPIGITGNAAPNRASTLTDTTTLNVGATAATTWGMSVVPTVSFQRVHQRSDEPLLAATLPRDPFQQASIGLAVVQHLLRGAGWVGAASAVDHTTGLARAAEHTVNFAAQQQALTAASAYFQYVALGEQVGLLRNAMAGAQRLVDETRVLVASDQRPRADLHQLEGNLANRTRAVLEAETDRSQALFALRTAMGLGAEGGMPWTTTNALPAPAAVGDENELIRRATERREDLLAAHEVLGASSADLRGAEWNTNLNLDLNGSVGYTGLLNKDGVGPFFAAAGSNVPGVNAGIGVAMELPFNNTSRIADRNSKRASVDQARIAEADIKRRVPIDTMSAVAELRLAEAALQASAQAVESYALAFGDEEDRMHSGAGTVIDMLLTEDRLISARLARTANHLRYALARSRLLFAIGGMPSDPVRTQAALQALSTP